MSSNLKQFLALSEIMLNKMKEIKTRNGYVYSTEEKARKAFNDFREHFATATITNRELLSLTFDEENLIVHSKGDNTETHYISLEGAVGKEFLNFVNFLFIDVVLEDLPQNLLWAFGKTRRG